jgi:hypothetical protein
VQEQVQVRQLWLQPQWWQQNQECKELQPLQVHSGPSQPRSRRHPVGTTGGSLTKPRPRRLQLERARWLQPLPPRMGWLTRAAHSRGVH